MSNYAFHFRITIRIAFTFFANALKSKQDIWKLLGYMLRIYHIIIRRWHNRITIRSTYLGISINIIDTCLTNGISWAFTWIVTVFLYANITFNITSKITNTISVFATLTIRRLNTKIRLQIDIHQCHEKKDFFYIFYFFLNRRR